MPQGTDDKARQLIQEDFPAYDPWVESLFTPEAGTEKMLFLAQTLVGLGLFLYCMYRLGACRRSPR